MVDTSGNVHSVILAAGQGTRMNSGVPKVLHPIAGKPMLGHVLEAATLAGIRHHHVVLGYGSATVRDWLRRTDIKVNCVQQSEQLGTAHAVQQAMPSIPEDAVVVVLCGDVPLIKPDTIRRLVTAARCGLAIVTAVLERPSGYGRVLRENAGQIVGVIEEKDATGAERSLTEVNAGLLGAPASLLKSWLNQVGNDNFANEYYLPDVVALAIRDAMSVQAVPVVSAREIAGVNNRQQLADAERVYQRDQADRLMMNGLQLMDPGRFDLRGELAFGKDVCIDVNCVFEGTIELGDEVSIGPGSILRNARIGAGTEILPYSVIDNAEIGQRCRVGPFARLRPGADLGAEVHIGNFVEIKNAQLGAGSKANHLAYIGDSDVGSRVNIGAGVITCNYDGVTKLRTVIGDDVFVGTDSQLIAPVTVGARAYIAAGSTIARDVPGDALTICRPREQKSVPGWKPKGKR